MKQPKFKKGDKVEYKSTGKIDMLNPDTLYTISKITERHNHFTYSFIGKPYVEVWEDELSKYNYNCSLSQKIRLIVTYIRNLLP